MACLTQCSSNDLTRVDILTSPVSLDISILYLYYYVKTENRWTTKHTFAFFHAIKSNVMNTFPQIYERMLLYFVNKIYKVKRFNFSSSASQGVISLSCNLLRSQTFQSEKPVKERRKNVVEKMVLCLKMGQPVPFLKELF